MPTDDKNVDTNLNKDGGTEDKSNQPVDFEVWLQAQPDNVKALYETHITGLKSALSTIRAEHDDYKKQLTSLSKQVEKGSEAEKQLLEVMGKVELAERRATFMEEAIRPEIGCKNPRTAYALATAEELFTRNGSPDWSQIKLAAPELFMAGAKGKAGSGTGDELKPQDMNAFIRRAAGV